MSTSTSTHKLQPGELPSMPRRRGRPLKGDRAVPIEKRGVAQTPAQRQSKLRRKKGGRQACFTMDVEVAAAILYIQKQWGMKGTKEPVQAALRFLCICTRLGLQTLPQSLDDLD